MKIMQYSLAEFVASTMQLLHGFYYGCCCSCYYCHSLLYRLLL